MNVKRFLLAGIAGFVVMFVLGALWHALLMKGFYATHYGEVQREAENIPVIALGMLVLGLLMAYAYPIGYRGGLPVAEGARFGVLVGLILALVGGIIYYGAFKITLTGTAVDAVCHVIEQGVGGLVIGLIYGSGTSIEAEA